MAKVSWANFWGSSRLMKRTRTKSGILRWLYRPVTTTKTQFNKSKKSLFKMIKKGAKHSTGGRKRSYRALSKSVAKSLVTSVLSRGRRRRRAH
jgi:hypothetical protein